MVQRPWCGSLASFSLRAHAHSNEPRRRPFRALDDLETATTKLPPPLHIALARASNKDSPFSVLLVPPTDTLPAPPPPPPREALQPARLHQPSAWIPSRPLLRHPALTQTRTHHSFVTAIAPKGREQRVSKTTHLAPNDITPPLIPWHLVPHRISAGVC